MTITASELDELVELAGITPDELDEWERLETERDLVVGRLTAAEQAVNDASAKVDELRLAVALDPSQRGALNRATRVLASEHDNREALRFAIEKIDRRLGERDDRVAEAEIRLAARQQRERSALDAAEYGEVKEHVRGALLDLESALAGLAAYEAGRGIRTGFLYSKWLPLLEQGLSETIRFIGRAPR
jgi:hypothetical protein